MTKIVLGLLAGLLFWPMAGRADLIYTFVETSAVHSPVTNIIVTITVPSDPFSLSANSIAGPFDLQGFNINFSPVLPDIGGDVRFTQPGIDNFTHWNLNISELDGVLTANFPLYIDPSDSIEFQGGFNSNTGGHLHFIADFGFPCDNDQTAIGCDFTFAAIPEPTTIPMFLVGVIGLLGWQSWQRRYS